MKKLKLVIITKNVTKKLHPQFFEFLTVNSVNKNTIFAIGPMMKKNILNFFNAL